MSESILSQHHFHVEEAAYAHVEARIWPNGPVCPKCGVIGRAGKLQGKSTRIGVYKCYECRKPFTVKVGTIFESSHIPLRIWLQAILLVAASKKVISANQLHRTLGVTLKSACFLVRRIRGAMKADSDQRGGQKAVEPKVARTGGGAARSMSLAITIPGIGDVRADTAAEMVALVKQLRKDKIAWRAQATVAPELPSPP